MKRRDFLLLAGVNGRAWNPAAAEVEIPRIGLIHAGSRQENQGLVGAFRESLSALGWTDGNNITVVDRWAEERTEALPAIVKELIGSGVTILVTAGTPATLAAKRATATIPIILVAVDDPVSIGVVESLGRPGGNATGLSLTSSEVITERLDLLRELVPGLHRLAVIVRHDPGLDQKLQDIRSETQRKGIEALMLETTTERPSNSPSPDCAAIAARRSMWLPGRLAPSSALGSSRWLRKLDCRRCTHSASFPLEGGLMSFAADYGDLFRRAAGFVDRILKGAKPGAIPVELPRKFDLTVNLKTAKTLGLTIPPAILATADKVIE